MVNHGTATYTLGQYNEVLVELVRVLPRALTGTDPKVVLRSLAGRGEAFSKALGRMIELFVEIPIFSRDMTKEGWELIEDASEPLEICIDDLELSSFLYQDEAYVRGEEMRNRTREMEAMLGQRHAEYLLGHQEEIPVEWRSHDLLFPGTIWRDRNDRLRVPCLYWGQDRWDLLFLRLALGFGLRRRLLRLSK